MVGERDGETHQAVELGILKMNHFICRSLGLVSFSQPMVG